MNSLETFLTSESPEVISENLSRLRNEPLDKVANSCSRMIGGQNQRFASAITAATSLFTHFNSSQSSVNPLKSNNSLWVNAPVYHNELHTNDVVLAFTKLVIQESVDTHTKQAGLIAAILHDLGHPGGTNTSYCELENNTVELVNNSGCLHVLDLQTRKLIADTIIDTAFMEKAEDVQARFLDGGLPLSAILRHADLFRSVYVDADNSLDSGQLLKSEFKASIERCPNLNAGFVETLDTPAAQMFFNKSNPSYLISNAGKALEVRRSCGLTQLMELLPADVSL